MSAPGDDGTGMVDSGSGGKFGSGDIPGLVGGNGGKGSRSVTGLGILFTSLEGKGMGGGAGGKGGAEFPISVLPNPWGNWGGGCSSKLVGVVGRMEELGYGSSPGKGNGLPPSRVLDAGGNSITGEVGNEVVVPSLRVSGGGGSAVAGGSPPFSQAGGEPVSPDAVGGVGTKPT